MKEHNAVALHDRIDEMVFELRLQLDSIKSLQTMVNELEAALRELRGAALERNNRRKGRYER